MLIIWPFELSDLFRPDIGLSLYLLTFITYLRYKILLI